MISIWKRLYFFSAVFLILAPATGLGRSKINSNPFSITEIQPLKQEFRTGEPLHFKLKWQLAPEYHAYYEEFKVAPKTPPDAKVTVQDIREVIEFHDQFSKRVRQGVKGSGDIYIRLEAPGFKKADLFQGEIELTYQACAEDHCLLPKKITVPLQAGLKGAAHPTLLGNQFDPSHWRIWLTVFLAGLLTSFTPCVFPLIPITLALLGTRGAHVSHTRGFVLSLSYVTGIAFTYALLGLLAASTGMLFGSFLGHPLVSGFLALLFLFLGLSVLGLFPLEAPAFLRARLLKQKSQSGLPQNFMTGVVAGIVASPCVGPVLAAVLTYVAQTRDLVFGFALLFVFAMGLGQLFLLLGTFSGFQKYLPKSGRWLLFTKYIFALSFFALSLFYAAPWLKDLRYFGSGVQEEQGLERLPWQAYSDELRAKAAAEGRPVVLDFYADWCAACKELEIKTFSRAEIQKYKDEFVFLKFDATRESPEFEPLRVEFEIVGLPHLVFLDQKGEWKKELTLTGFEDAPDFAERLMKALGRK